jgi:hypothetical protein
MMVDVYRYSVERSLHFNKHNDFTQRKCLNWKLGKFLVVDVY